MLEFGLGQIGMQAAVNEEVAVDQLHGVFTFQPASDVGLRSGEFMLLRLSMEATRRYFSDAEPILPCIALSSWLPMM